MIIEIAHSEHDNPTMAGLRLWADEMKVKRDRINEAMKFDPALQGQHFRYDCGDGTAVEVVATGRWYTQLDGCEATYFEVVYADGHKQFNIYNAHLKI